MNAAPQAAALFAVDPAGLGGVLLRAAPGAARDRWLQMLAGLLPAAPRRLPLHADDARLLGGLDLVGTLQAGRPVTMPGLLAESDGGVLLLTMAERLAPATAARLAAVLDTGKVSGGPPARLGFVALDEGLADDERVPMALADRLAIHLQLDTKPGDGPMPTPADVAAARARLPAVQADAALMQALCEVCAALGIASLRAPVLALRVARTAAALAGRAQVTQDDAEVAARLVLAPRARRMPAMPQAETDAAPAAGTPEAAAQDAAHDTAQDSRPDDDAADDRPLAERVLDASRSALPAGLLQALAAGSAPTGTPAGAGRCGLATRSRRRGRPIGSERGDARAGARLDLLASLRAAAPWQALRRREHAEHGERGADAPAGTTLHWRRDDFRVRRFSERRATTTVFAVDASGSSALHRLAEAKGAVELLLADCYVRRDRVALLAFRGSGCELLLPPTHSLPRVRRSLAALPGGGGTPLAAGIAAAHALTVGLLRQGESPAVVLLTDGRANIARDGRPGRAAAHDDALKAARALRAAGVAALLLDTSPQPQQAAREVAAAMGARYLALPHADARQLSRAVDAAFTR